MAEIVLGIGTSHGPQLNMKPDLWPLLHEKDKVDRRIDYQALLAQARPGIEQDLTPEKWQERYDACHVALGKLRDKLTQARPDAIVVVGDDQREQFLDDNMPMFAIFYGPSMPITHRQREDAAPWQRAERQGEAHLASSVPCEESLASHLIDSLRDDEFDIAVSNQLKPSVGLGHAFTFLYRYVHPEGTIPMVPLMINTFFPPNQPTPRRCYALGRSLRSAIESWDSDRRVVVVASGGLSHTIIEEDLDQIVLDALMEKDSQALCSLPMERLIRGTSEIRNWVTLGGAVEPLDMTLVDYVPCYRSPAETGCAMGFAYWE